MEQESNDKEENVQVAEKECENIASETQGVQSVDIQRVKNKCANGGTNSRRGDGMVDRTTKESKLATRVGSFKGKSGTQGKRGVENIVEKIGVDLLEKVLDHEKQSNNILNDGEATGAEKYKLGPILELSSSTTPVVNPNVPRPPNWLDTPPKIPSTIAPSSEEEQMEGGEVFVDANDQGSIGSLKSDMEVVVETPSLT
jgi:hypothetical protein